MPTFAAERSVKLGNTGMKKSISFVLLLFVAIAVMCQNTESKDSSVKAVFKDEDSSKEQYSESDFRERLGDVLDLMDDWLFFHDDDFFQRKKSRGRGSFEAHWAGLQFGYLNFTGSAAETYDAAYRLSGGWRFAWNFFDIEIPFSYRCGLLTGLGYESNVFFAARPTEFSQRMFKQPETGFIDTDRFLEVQKSKLVARYLLLPLVFEVQSRNGKFAFDLGAVFGWNFYSRLKTETVEQAGSCTEKYKDASKFNMNDFKAEATARISYSCLQLYFSASMTSLFDPSVHDYIYPYSVGLTFVS